MTNEMMGPVGKDDDPQTRGHYEVCFTHRMCPFVTTRLLLMAQRYCGVNSVARYRHQLLPPVFPIRGDTLYFQQREVPPLPVGYVRGAARRYLVPKM